MLSLIMVGRGGVLLFVVLATAFNYTYAQVSGTQYFMNSVPQFNNNNPAFIPKYRYTLGLPGSMVDVGYYNNGFTLKELEKQHPDLPAKTYIITTAQVDLFRLGFQTAKNTYISLNSTVRGYGYAMTPRDALALLTNDKADYAGRAVNISPRAQQNLFWENSIGVALSPTEKLTVGARIKLLRGFVNTTTTIVNSSITTNDSVTVAADMVARTSGVQNLRDGFHLANYSGNNGLAFDLGATFKPTPKLTIAASLVDIGSIKWRNDLYQYTLDKSTNNYTSPGIDISSLRNDEPSKHALADSVKAHFMPKESPGSSYTTILPAKMLASANYNLKRDLTVGAMAYAERYMGRLATGVTFGMNKHFGKVVSTTLSYMISNRSYNNLGAGISLNLAPVQMYVVGDHVLFLSSTQVFTLRAGLNFVWGWNPDIERERDMPRKKKGSTPNYVKVREKKG